MDAKLKADWVAALRSGEYEQARLRLRDGQKLCCIAVGYVVLTGGRPTFTRTRIASDAIGLVLGEQDKLVNLNDFSEKTFPEIADYIEQNL